MSVSPSASTSWRIFAASARMRLVSASPSACTISTRLRRSAVSVSRAVNTRSSSVTALARAWSAAACASYWSFDCSAMAMARCCSASSIVLRRSISSASICRSRAMRSSSTARSEVMRPLGLLILQRLLARDVGTLRRPLHLQLAGLLQARVLEVTVDVERLPLGVQVLVADLDHGVLLDVVALLLARLDGLGQPRQALGVEGVRRIEELHRGLVELGE